MELLEKDDLVIALVDRDEAEDGRLPQSLRKLSPAIDVIRLADSAKLDDATLERLGFVARPEWINWVASVGGSEEEYLLGLSRGERSEVRRARRFAADRGLRLEVRTGLSEAFLDEFMDLYEGQIARMPRGRNFARRWTDRLLDSRSELVTVGAFSGSAMTAGAIWWIREEQSLLQLRFSASADDGSIRAVRALYAEALQFARDSGLRFASLGNDPALFGHVVQTGLCIFKSRFGFAPIPSEILDDRLWGEFADRFVSLRALADPSVVLSWGRHRGAHLTWPQAADSVALQPYVISAADEVASVGRLPAPRRILIPGR
ncbi:hypothetical protein [Streptomyces sp. NPDC021224]|uniref:hypothetical protein n=1 Tax=unclassified Streptomyces TaxID=2593676 RepID=UPI0037940596